MTRLRIAHVTITTLLLLVFTPFAAADIIYQQSFVLDGSVTPGGIIATDFVAANDFVVSAPSQINRFSVLLRDGGGAPNNGIFDNFSGTLGWGIYNNNVANKPGTLLASGTTTTASLVRPPQSFGDEFFVATVDISSLNVGAGTYWLAIREGAWGTSYADGSYIDWMGTSEAGFSTYYDSDEASASSWTALAGTKAGFTIEGSAAAVPEPSSILLCLTAAGAMYTLRKRRLRAANPADVIASV